MEDRPGHGIDTRVEAAYREVEGYDHVNQNLVDPQQIREMNSGYKGGPGSRPEDKDPHDEGPRYDEWANGFENEDALSTFSGLWSDDQ